MKKSIQTQTNNQLSDNIRYSLFLQAYEESTSREVFWKCENNLMLGIPDIIFESIDELVEITKKQ